MPTPPMTRRSALGRLTQGVALTAIAGALGAGRLLAATPTSGLTLTHGELTLTFDTSMRSRVLRGGLPLTGWSSGEAVRLADGSVIADMPLLRTQVRPVEGRHGRGVQHGLHAAAGGVEREVRVTLLERFPSLALVEVVHINRTDAPVAVSGWRALTHDVAAHPDGAWTFAGASYPDRRDWIQKVTPDFNQRNFMGMNGSDYGGGTPVAVVWRRDGGLAVGHLSPVPELVSFPVAAQPGGVRIGVSADRPVELKPGESVTTPTLFLTVHGGDHFRPVDAYRRLMADQGFDLARVPASSYAPVWCAWGYERDVTLPQVYGTLGKAQALKLEWAVLDDGWQDDIGDWALNPAKFPNGDADMVAFTGRIKASGMRPRLWIAPLAAHRDARVLRDHPDMLLLDRDGAAQNVSFWNSYTLCPAYAPTVDHFRKIVRRIVGEWGYEGLKIDGQHLNGVAPCYNPAHNHKRPEESFEKLQDFWKAMHAEAVAANPDVVVEMCPCGDAFAFHNAPAINHTPASDPTSSWQVRLKGKTFKAMLGPSAPFAGDHVELSDGGRDFASSYGIGAVLSTKFTWPRDPEHTTEPLPPGGYVLTPEKEAWWRRWIALYHANMLSKGDYRGDLYDIGFDKPEAHAIAANGAMHYAFYAERWSGAVPLRGLDPDRRYRLTDSFSGKSLGEVAGDGAVLQAAFDHAQMVEARPLDGNAA